MNAKLIIVLGFLVAAGALVFFGLRKHPEPGPAGSTPAAPAPAAPPLRDAVAITFVYSTEKQDWIAAMLPEFQKLHPEIEVNLVGKGSIEAAQDIQDDKL